MRGKDCHTSLQSNMFLHRLFDPGITCKQKRFANAMQRGGGVSQRQRQYATAQLSALASCRLFRCFVACTHIEHGFAAVTRLVLGSRRPKCTYTWSPRLVVICIQLDSQKACVEVTSPSSSLLEQIAGLSILDLRPTLYRYRALCRGVS